MPWMKASLSAFALVVLPLALAGCPRDRKTNDEFAAGDAKLALEESALDSQAQSLSSDVVELSTNFSIGGAVETAAQELHEFLTSQLPCATVTRSAGTIVIDYGAAGAVCLYRGRRITGQSEVTISRNDATEVRVEHTWNGLSNGIIQVDGTASVTYDLTDPSRHVEHQVTISRLSDGLTLEGAGDRVQKPLPAGIAVGFEVNGTRDWTSARGSSALTISGVQMRWVDPVPQAGSYLLTTPRNHDVAINFARLDDDTIGVTLASGGRQFKFNVTKAGSVSQVE